MATGVLSPESVPPTGPLLLSGAVIDLHQSDTLCLHRKKKNGSVNLILFTGGFVDLSQFYLRATK